MTIREEIHLNTIQRELGLIVGSKYVSTSIFECIKSSIDPMPYEIKKSQIPLSVVLPGSKEEVSEIFRYANKNTIPVFIRGSGTQLNGASRPHTPGIVILTRRMNRIEVLEDSCYFECECGARCGDVTKTLEKSGYFLPLYPGSRVIASMGGLISNNTSGHLTDPRTGKPGDYVLGLEVVLPTGEIIETGTTGLRKPAGTDLTKLFVGSDGLLGFIYKIRMRLVPALPKAYGISYFPNLTSLAKGVQQMYLDKCSPPLFMEFMSLDVAKLGFEIKHMPPPPGPVLLMVTDGESKEEARKKANSILSSFKKAGGINLELVENEEEWNKLWETREVIGSYIMQKTGGKLINSEISANLKSLPKIMGECETLNLKSPLLKNFPPLMFGHIGALTIHVSFLLPPDLSDEKYRETTDILFKLESEMNSKYKTCGGEWGQFSKRKDFFIQRYGQKSYDIVKSIKSALDPNNILNPGILEGLR